MLNNVKTISELKMNAIKIKNGEKVVVHWPQFGKNQEQAFNLERDHCVNEHTYTVNKSVIAFYERGTLYVVPYFKKAIELLEEQEYGMSDMYVPFSNEEYPIAEKQLWHDLKREAKEVCKDDFETECLEFCQSILKVSPMPNELLENKCMLFPYEGIQICNSKKGEIRIYPEVTGYVFDCPTMDALARYCTKNDVTTFVNADGKQYITKSNEVLQKLKEAGYKYDINMDVPFCNDEEPDEEKIFRIWNSL